jgi:hypothetical protein
VWKDRKEAWQDANTINDPDFRETIKKFDIEVEKKLKEFDKKIKE